ncbi:CidA/LrgA family protein [Neptunomonas phycophila]|uniref:CidA/LrgA family protein n=1 Tax=Neptunomonas phycophila TaxID=1572645 RepID=UPI0030FAFE5E
MCDDEDVELLNGFLVLLVCQFLGELAVMASGVPVPGPVIGMLLLLVLLAVLKRTPADIRLVSEGLLRYLAFLYVPAGVGLMVHAKLLADYWLPLTIALMVSTFLALFFTAAVFKLAAKLDKSRHKAKEESA